MKKIILLLFLALTTNLFAQEDTIYKKVFDNVEKECDSLTDIRSCYLSEFNYVLNQKIVEELLKDNSLSDFLEKPIYLEIEVDANGKFKILKMRTKSGKIDKIITDFVPKLPAIKPLKNITYSNENLNAILDFNLRKYRNKEDETEEEKVKKIRKEKTIPPKFKDCQDSNNNEEILNCFVTNINSHVVENFKYPIKALNKNIDGKTMNFFIINTKGNVEKFISFGSDFILLKESLRIMKLIPKLIPGRLNDETINVSFTQPIVFKIH